MFLSTGSPGKDRDGQCDRLLRDVLYPRKTAVVDLLVAADLVERHDLGGFFIVEIGDRRVVEGDMSVLPDTHHYDIRRIFVYQRAVSFGFRFGVGRGGIDVIHRSERDPVENRPAQKVAEALWGVG